MAGRGFLPALLLAGLLVPSTPAGAQSAATGPRVVPVYLVPSDLPIPVDRIAKTAEALAAVRHWYARVLRGRTYRSDPLIVQVSRHDFAEFAADSFQAWWPLLQSEFKRYGLDWEDPDTKMLWIANGAGAWAGSDSENGGIDSMSQAGRMPRGDRGGLAVVGDSSVGGVLAGVCPDSGRTGTAWWCSWKTFEGTLAHELGHTWGLPHPDAFLKGFRCADSTAWTNMQCHWGFPFDSLLPYEQIHLRSLRYFEYSEEEGYRLMTAPGHVRGELREISFDRDRELLWMDGWGGGRGYLNGFVLHGRAVWQSARAPRLLALEIGLPRGVPSATGALIRIGRSIAYQRSFAPGAPPLPVVLRVPAGSSVVIESVGAVGLGNTRWYPVPVP
jgi:hypothetical protein